MSITFRCPHCNKLVGFCEKHSGRRAKCLSCQKKFIIPGSSIQKAEKVIEPKEVAGKSLKGFYRAALIDTWRIVFQKTALVVLVSIIVGISGRFGLCLLGSEFAREMTLGASGDWIIGFGAAFKAAIDYAIVLACIIGIAVLWGRMWDLYLSILRMTAIETDQFVDPMELGTLMFWYHGIKPFFFAGLAVVAAGFPFFVGLIIFDSADIEYNLLEFKTGGQIILQFLGLLSVLILPSVFISLAVNNDFEALKPTNILPPIFKRFIPYIFLCVLFTSLLYLDLKWTFVDVYNDTSMETVKSNFWYVLGLQIFMIVLMRWMGLFYRHYGCYFKM